MQRVAVGLRTHATHVRFAFLGQGRDDLVFLQESLDADDDTRPARHHPLEDATRHTLFGDELLNNEVGHHGADDGNAAS